MKMAIGDIVDRYTICKLKFERSKIDNSKEINDLFNEIQKYENIDSYIDKLYKLHGEIWDLEGDIRKGNEAILGLEEVGRRALILRDMNKIRISIKNEINSKYGEGYIEVKVDHGSEIETSLVVSLSTVPERLNDPKDDGIKLVMKHICELDDDDYEIHFNVPIIYNVTGEKYIIPDWLHEYSLKYKHLRVFRTEDVGPPTKFVPTIQRITNPERIVLVVDDDLMYHPDMIKEHRRWQNELKDSVVCYAGGGAKIILYPDEHSLRDSWIACVTQVREATSLQHYKSVSYKRKIFDEDFWKYYFGRTLSDDSLVSRYCLDKNIPMCVVPYEPENHLFETLELWNENLRVETFPVLRNSSSVSLTGCNHPGLLALPMGQRFFDPPNLGDRSYINGIDPPRIMSWSQKRGYYYIDDPEPEEQLITEEITTVPVIEEPVQEVIEDPVQEVIIEPELQVIEEPEFPIIVEQPPETPIITEEDK